MQNEDKRHSCPFDLYNFSDLPNDQMRERIVFAQGFVVVREIFEPVANGENQRFHRRSVLGRSIGGQNEANGSGVTKRQTFDLKRIARQFVHRPVGRLSDGEVDQHAGTGADPERFFANVKRRHS